MFAADKHAHTHTGVEAGNNKSKCARWTMISFPDMRNNRKVSNSSPSGNQHNAFRTLDPCELIDARRVKERGY